MPRSSSRFARVLLVVSTAALVSPPVHATGLGAASGFAVLGGSSVYVDTMSFAGGAGHVAGYSLELTDKVHVKGSAIATAGFYAALELGDKSVIKGRCVSGGGVIVTPAQHPAKCLQGRDETGGDPLLLQTLQAMTDVSSLRAALGALTPTAVVTEIDNASGTNGTMSFAPGLNVISVTSRFLVESSSTLMLDAPPGSTVVFLVDGDFTMQSKAKLVLTGGLHTDSVAYVVNGNVVLGTGARAAGTVIEASGTCLQFENSRLTGALFCDGGIAFSFHAKMTWAPLRASFP